MHHHAWEDWLLQGLDTSRKSEEQRRETISSTVGTGETAGVAQQ